MKGVILAAGLGKRLEPLTLTTPKCLIPIAGRPVLDRQLEALTEAGIRHTWIVTGSLADQVEKHLAGRPETACVHNPAYAVSNILASFELALSQADDREGLLVMAGDVVFGSDIVRRLLAAASRSDLALCHDRRVCQKEEVKVILNGTRIARLGKDLDPASARGEFLGLFAVSARLLPQMRRAVADVLTTRRSTAYLFDMLNTLIDRGVAAEGVDVGDALWEEIDFLEDVERASKKLQSVDAARAAQGRA